MAQIKISNLPSGTPLSTDLTPATDTQDPTEAASGTTKKYTRSAELQFYLEAMGLSVYTSVIAASQAPLTATYSNGTLGVGATLTNATTQAAFTLDGVTLVVGDRVLIKDQATQAQNGIYTITTLGTDSTNWVLTRSADFNESDEVIFGGVVLVDKGDVSAGLLYEQTEPGPFVMGTTAIIFAQYIGGQISDPVLLEQGGTSANLTASNGGIFYSNATTGAILAGTATASQMLQSGASAAPTWSASTWPSNTTTNQLLYSSTTNTVTGLATAANAMLVTSTAGVPSLSRVIQPTFVTDTANLNITGFSTVASAVNYLDFSNAATAGSPSISVLGTDTNINLNVFSKGTGNFVITSANLTTPFTMLSGTASQHSTSFAFANTAATRTVTFPDADFTVLQQTTASFTPVLVSSGGGTATYASRAGTYYQIGNVVNFTLSIVLTGLPSAGDVTITGLPGTSVVTTTPSIWANALNAAVTSPLTAVVAASTVIPYTWATGAPTQLTVGGMTASSTIIVTGSYYVA